jgi:hypothetical protein
LVCFEGGDALVGEEDVGNRGSDGDVSGDAPKGVNGNDREWECNIAGWSRGSDLFCPFSCVCWRERVELEVVLPPL